jgi:hypothetical protein
VNLYQPGDVATLRATFTNLAGTAVDPATVTLALWWPDPPWAEPTVLGGSLTTYTYGAGTAISRVGTGLYAAEVLIPSGYGETEYTFQGSGSGLRAVMSGAFWVAPTRAE